MKKENVNKMASMPMKKLFWKMGLPMIVSMILQALYNVVDSIFVANIKGVGALANEALTLAFPIQILMVAIGVGTGVDLNALLSKYLGEQDKEKLNKLSGTGIIVGFIIFIIFFLFGLLGTKWFINCFTEDATVLEMGSAYLRICCIYSLGSIGYTIYERFLQATGKTNLSTIAQISGAVCNIILDYVFIFPLNLGVKGAAYATVIGQFLSLFIAMYFHYTKNKEIDGSLRYLNCDLKNIKDIYHIGISASIMQALLSVMMAGMNAILGTSPVSSTILVGSFGIYYKIQQVALFAAFGLSNTIISILSFNYGMKNKERSIECIKDGIIDTLIVTLVLTIIFEVFAYPLSSLFGSSGGSTSNIIDTCTKAIRIASIGYIFMGLSIAIQGILQALNYSFYPLLIALFRLVIFVFPIASIFVKQDNVLNTVWWTFPIAEVLTSIISIFILKYVYHKKIISMKEYNTGKNYIISISRMHGSCGKKIAKILADKLNINFYDKEEIKEYAIKNNITEYKDKLDLYDEYLSLDASKDAIISQSIVIRDIAKNESCLIVGRAADYILKDNPNLVKIYLYANDNYRIKKIQEMYHDSKEDAIKNMKKSDKSRAAYYEVVSSQKWGNPSNYDICLDTSIGIKESVKVLLEYLNNNKKINK